MTIETIVNDRSKRAARKRNRDAFERSVAVLREFRQNASPEEMERIAVQLERALNPPDARSLSPERAAFLSALTGGRTFSEQERLELEAAGIARYFRRRQELIKETVSAAEAARLLGTCRQTPHDRVKAETMLAVRERGMLRFPRWQFDPEGPNGVLAGLPQVLQALQVSSMAKAAWFVRSNPYLKGRTAVEALRAGEVERLVVLARGVGIS